MRLFILLFALILLTPTLAFASETADAIFELREAIFEGAELATPAVKELLSDVRAYGYAQLAMAFFYGLLTFLGGRFAAVFANKAKKAPFDSAEELSNAVSAGLSGLAVVVFGVATIATIEAAATAIFTPAIYLIRNL